MAELGKLTLDVDVGPESNIGKALIELKKDIEAARDEHNERLVWRSTTPAYIQFITEAKYQKLSEEVKKWYEPVCQKCNSDEQLLRDCYDYIRSVKLSDVDVCRGIGVFTALRMRVAPEDIPKMPKHTGVALS